MYAYVHLYKYICIYGSGITRGARGFCVRRDRSFVRRHSSHGQHLGGQKSGDFSIWIAGGQVDVCCSVLQCVTMCCSLVQCGTFSRIASGQIDVQDFFLQSLFLTHYNTLQHAATHCHQRWVLAISHSNRWRASSLAKEQCDFFLGGDYSIASMKCYLYKWHIYTAGFWEFIQFDIHNP